MNTKQTGFRRLGQAEAEIHRRRSETAATSFAANTAAYRAGDPLGSQPINKERTMLNLFEIKTVIVGDADRALLWRNRQFVRVLEAGVYRFWDPLNRLSIRSFDLREPEVELPEVDVLLNTHPQMVAETFQVVELADREIGLVYIADKLQSVLGPGSRRVYLRGPVAVRVDRIDISENFAVDPAIARQLARNGSSMAWAEVGKQQIGLLTVDGVLERTLETGTHAFWKFQRSISVEVIDLRWQNVEVTGQEMLTQDKVSLRINLSASWRVVDAIKAVTELKGYADFLYRELQFGLRQAVATRTLDTLLGDKGALEGEIFTHVRDRVAENGLELRSVGVKDIILPGDMKLILNQVVEAEKAAQANVIRRREETAATRSALNTAKLMADNPALMRLKELETLEKVTDKIDKLTVFGGLDGVLNDVVKLRSSAM